MDGDVSEAVLRLPGAKVIRRWRRRFASQPWAAAAELAARLGYVSRGMVYLSIGLIALLAVAHLTPHTRGPLGALEAWAHWRLGGVRRRFHHILDDDDGVFDFLVGHFEDQFVVHLQ